MSRKEFYHASQEVVDSLRLESSTVTPEFNSRVGELARMTSDSINSMYGRFVPERTKSKIKEIDKRLIVTNGNSYWVFHKEWGGKEPDRSGGVTHFLGHFIVLMDVVSRGSATWSYSSQDYGELWEPLKEEWIKYGSEEDAIRAIGENRFGPTVMHETIHLLHGKGITNLMAECGVSFYQQKVAEELGFSHELRSPVDKIQADIYSSTLGDFGEDTHKVYFGSLENPHLSIQMTYNLSRKLERKMDEIRNRANYRDN